MAASDATSALAMVESNIVVVVTVPVPPACVAAKLFNIVLHRGYMMGVEATTYGENFDGAYHGGNFDGAYSCCGRNYGENRNA